MVTRAVLPEPDARSSSRGYWERQKYAATKWTVNSTMAIAKAAMENGMPEPPETFFETQDRLVEFFAKHGELKVFDPRQVVVEAGSELEDMYIVEEGSLIAEKDVIVTLCSAKPGAGSKITHGEARLVGKAQEMRRFKKERSREEGAISETGEMHRRSDFGYEEEGDEATIGASEAAELDDAPLIKPPVEVIKLSTLEQHEVVGDVPLIEGSAVEMRYKADAEGAALRVLPRDALVAEMHRDPVFAGNVFKNIAITLSVKCEEICWRLEDMAVEASSMAWRTGMRRKHKQKFAVSKKEARRLQELLGVPPDEQLHHSTTASFEHSMRVHGSLLVFSESLCFYARVFGMVVKKVLPVDRIVAVLRDTPATADVEAAIEVACIEETLIFSAIPDLRETCEAINEVLTLARKARRGSVTQTLELSAEAREAAKRTLQAPVAKAKTADSFDARFQLAAEDWLDFLQREAHCCVYGKGEVIVAQGSETDALFQIARGCVRLEKTTHLGDGTVVISRLGPPAVFGEFFFLMGTRTASLTSFVADMEGTELYIIKPESLQPYQQSKPMMPVCLYKYLAASMARKYRVLSATAGFGLARTGVGAHVSMEEVIGNTVFLGIYARYLKKEKPELGPWLMLWQEVQEFRVMPRGMSANKQAKHISATYVQPGGKAAVPLGKDIVEAVRQNVSPAPNQDGTTALARPNVFDAAAAEIFEAMRAHSFTKFVASSHFAGVQELKAREKEVPGVHHFYYLKKLGTGSFGEVYAVRKKDSHTMYAMKVMSKQAQAQMSRRWAMYLRIECDVMASLHHPFLVNLNYSFQTPTTAFMVLDIVSGGDLDHFQRRFKEQPPSEEVLRLMCAQLISGISYMHGAGIIHRDIKPPNVLIDEEGNLRITDFGLSLKLKDGEFLYDKTGTKPYMAPELHLASKSQNRGYTFPVDWYAMGVTVWEILSGGASLPPPTQSVLEVLRAGERMQQHHFINVSASSAGLPTAGYSPACRDFLEQLLEIDPAQRIGTATILQHAFFNDLNFAAVTARRVPVPWGAEVLEDLARKAAQGAAEGLEERKTAAETLKGLSSEAELEEVKDFDFVSPRAVMEEYMGNMYALRGAGAEL